MSTAQFARITEPQNSVSKWIISSKQQHPNEQWEEEIGYVDKWFEEAIES